MDKSVDMAKKIIASLLFLIFLAYQAVGFFPIAPLDGDGNGVANGITLILQNKQFGDNWAAFSFPIQPGTFAITTLIALLLKTEPLNAYALVTAVSSVLFIIIGGLLVSRLTSISFPICGIILLLFQETLAGGYYGNGNITAAVLAISAVYIAAVMKGKWYELIIIGILSGIGAWIRLDSVIIHLGIFLLILSTAGWSWKTALVRYLVVVSIAILVGLSGLYLSGSNISLVLKYLFMHLGTQHPATPDLGIPFLGTPDAKSLLSYFSLLMVFLIILGLFGIIKLRKWFVLGFLSMCILPFFIIYRDQITTAEYMYYLIPFWGIAAVWGIKQVLILRNKRKYLFWGVIVFLFVAQYLIGLRVSFASKPYIKEPHPTILKIFEINKNIGPINSISIVIGPGTFITTASVGRLSSGLFFSPIYWSSEKANLNKEINKFTPSIVYNDERIHYVVADEYHAKQFISYYLLNHNYSCIEGSEGSLSCTGSMGQILVFYEDNESRSFSTIEQFLSNISFQRLIFVTFLPWKQYLIAENSQDWVQLCDFAYVVNEVP
jgi:hypothetical protein